MATRSLIGYMNSLGGVTFAYCHYDGYPENQLPILNDHYQTRILAESLINRGGFSSLVEHIENIQYYTQSGVTLHLIQYPSGFNDSGAKYIYIIDLQDVWHVLKVGDASISTLRSAISQICATSAKIAAETPASEEVTDLVRLIEKSPEYPLTFKLSYGEEHTKTAQYTVETAMDKLFIECSRYDENEGTTKAKWRAYYCNADHSDVVMKDKSLEALKDKIQSKHDERMNMLLNK